MYVQVLDKFIGCVILTKQITFYHSLISLRVKLSLLIKGSNISGNLTGNLIFIPGPYLKVQYLHFSPQSCLRINCILKQC